MANRYDTDIDEPETRIERRVSEERSGSGGYAIIGIVVGALLVALIAVLLLGWPGPDTTAPVTGSAPPATSEPSNAAPPADATPAPTNPAPANPAEPAPAR